MGGATHHGHGLRGDHLLGSEGGEVRQVGQDVHGGDDGQGDDDGAREVPSEEPQTSQPDAARGKRAADGGTDTHL